MRDKTNINSLVAKKLLGVATSEEERQLDLLLSENPELKSKIDKMLDNQSFVERYRQFASIDRRKAKRRFFPSTNRAASQFSACRSTCG